jgi:hypothetical protein
MSMLKMYACERCGATADADVHAGTPRPPIGWIDLKRSSDY